ncbi:hypothetical protein N7457_003711 [Penicillium paradoxum]|uniref:uncharacterized protein n=1 Tax=Penicillium paradoxum TaxID=176176 RepID=UPI002548CC60|nr:uncharacterized protein N7457_003711 [Penicillium paradoxum]KAJ5788721.1 hypothetical protein N7457_003711 [Penicillium paradoxum]
MTSAITNLRRAGPSRVIPELMSQHDLTLLPSFAQSIKESTAADHHYYGFPTITCQTYNRTLYNCKTNAMGRVYVDCSKPELPLFKRYLQTILEEYAVIHVRGTPGSGKTMLSEALYLHLLGIGPKVVLFRDWARGKSPVDHLVVDSVGQGYWTQTYRILHNDITFIIDQAQETYSDVDFWNQAIKPSIGHPERSKYCLFSSYESASHGPEYNERSLPTQASFEYQTRQSS